MLVLWGMLFSIPSISFTQTNLVVNPNCDIYDTCPDNTFQINRALGWWSYDSWGTPDYVNECSDHYLVGIPNDFGSQIPKSGSGYIHAFQISSHKPRNLMFWTGDEFGYVQAREAFGGTFIQPLNPVPHKIEFYINFANVGYDDGMGGGDGRVATNAFDLMLLDQKETVFNAVSPYIDLNNVIQIYKEGTVINDTLNWIKLSTCFIPNGGENYFVLGAFRDTNEIILEFSGSSFADYYGGNYFFDSFNVYECDTCCLGEFSYNDHVNISNNPANSNNPTTFTVVLNSNTTAELYIYDSAGRLVARKKFYDLVTDYVLDELARGVYHYSFLSSNGIKEYGKILAGF